MSAPPYISSERKTGRQAGAWRSAGRFPLACEVSFRKSGQAEPVGKGRTVNMSSTGVLFRTDQRLQIGEELELTLRWPLHAVSEHALDLHARGKVVRAQPGLVAVYFTRCEFRKSAAPGS